VTFYADDQWQRQMRDLILKPHYDRMFPGRYRFIEYGDPLGAGGTDTIIDDRRIDEKIVRWPRNPDGSPKALGYDAFALETMSCTIEGRERDGWMKTNTVEWLFYCFASRKEHYLDCFMLDMPELQEWFWAQQHEQWPRWRSKEINRTECLVVPILQATSVVRYKFQRLVRPPYYDEQGHFLHPCNTCGNEDASNGYGMLGGELGTWYCKEHRP